MNAGLVLAAAVMAAFALIPRRLWCLRLPAVLGWALIWVDGTWATHWTDSAGLAVTGLSLLWWLVGDRHPDGRRPDGHARTK